MKINFPALPGKGDFYGGITAGIVALPLALAFGVQSGLGAIAGLYGAIVLGILASLFGGTPTQISGPTGPMTVVSASIGIMAIQHAGSLEKGIGMIIIIFFLAGLFQILFGVLRLGKYIRYIPYPVLSGFMSGIGIIIIVLQLFPMAGLTSPSSIIKTVLEIPEAIAMFRPVALLFGLGTIAIIYLFPLLAKKMPGTLIAVILMTALAYMLKSEIPVIGDIAGGLPTIRISEILHLQWSQLSYVFFPALTLAGLGSIDSLLTSVVADNITKTRHNSNRELIGQGIGNMAASLIGGIPGAGATMRTVVNIRSGGKSVWSGLIHGIFLLIILLGAGKLVSHIPLSVLAGILITVGISIIDRKGLADLRLIPRSDAVVLILVLVLTVFVDLLQAVGIGMVIASVLFMKRTGDMVDKNMKVAPLHEADEEMPWDDEAEITNCLKDQIYIVRLDGPLFFGSVNQFQYKINGIPAKTEVVVIRMKRVPFLDQSGLNALESAILDMSEKKILVLLSMPQAQPAYMMRNSFLIPDLVSEEHVFSTFQGCAARLKDFCQS
ncbi:MAG: SulP family inorganic anion transporter [Bacteroidales bacterium]|nr:SulP family inorganic anion transporter [Bacteroidales bacterium]